jgi:hypothetical protein
VQTTYCYAHAGNQTSAMLDTDNALTSFYAACADAGPELCAIHANTTEGVRARVDALINAVHVAPLPVYDSSNPAETIFGVVDYSLVVDQVLSTLEFPYSSGPSLAAALAALEQGNTSLIFAGSGASVIESLDFEACSLPPSQPFQAGLLDIVSPIACGDGPIDQDDSFQAAYGAYQEMLSLSSFANTWYNALVEPCS